MAATSSEGNKVKLVNILDWPKFFAEHREEELFYNDILNMLDSETLSKLLELFEEMVNDNLIFNCYNVIKEILIDRNFNNGDSN